MNAKRKSPLRKTKKSNVLNPFWIRFPTVQKFKPSTITLVILAFLLGSVSTLYFYDGVVESKSQNTFQKQSTIYKNFKICFTPGQNCEKLILKSIQNAKKSIRVQCYSFTSKPIARAILSARNRGVRVKIIADKSQKKQRHSQIPILRSRGVAVVFDTKPAIAHNKIIIIDNRTILTGSYNWTNAAANRNAENLLIIRDAFIARQYLHNFKMRERASRP